MNRIMGMAACDNTVPDLWHGLRQLARDDRVHVGVVVHGHQGPGSTPARLHRRRGAAPVSDGPNRLQGRVGMGHTNGPGAQGMPVAMPGWSRGPGGDLNRPVQVAVVAQGQMHNTDALRGNLIDRGYRFSSDSDSELLAHLIDATRQNSPVQAVQRAMGLLNGDVALGVMFHDKAGCVLAAQRGLALFWCADPRRTAWASERTALPCPPHAVRVLGEGQVLECHPDAGRMGHRLHSDLSC